MQEIKREKIWKLCAPKVEQANEKAALLANKTGLSPLLTKTLLSRGYDTPEKITAYFGREDTSLYDPFLLADIDKAVDRILSAIDKKEKIAIFGDYDVDGVTSVTLVYDYLSKKGASVSYYIPSRFGDGYGLSKNAIEGIAKDGVTLIITVDNGISAKEEVAFAASLGVDTVVTDHHECPNDLPDAVAVVNPHRPDDGYPFNDLAGVGVIFKVVTACELEEARRRGTEDDESVVRRICKEYLDLVALGSVADSVPLTDENRLLVTYGLERLKKTNRMGLDALIRAAMSDRPKKINSVFINYQLAPRINAAGRIDSAARAVELLLSKDKAEAEKIAQELCEYNRERHAEESRTAEQAFRKIEEQAPEERRFVIVVDDDGWHQGVIGIVASSVTERYGLPSILITFDGASRGFAAGDDLGRGSGRSVRGVNLAQALFACNDLLYKGGGHEMAAGLTIRRRDIPAFRKAINEYAKEALGGISPVGCVQYDCKALPSDLTLKLAEEISGMEPFGQGNPEPLFLLEDVRLKAVIPISEGKHTRLILEKDGVEWTAVKFGTPPSKLPVEEEDLSDLLFHLSINEFRGKSTLQLIIEEIRPAESLVKELEKKEKRYAEILAGAAFSATEDIFPAREDFAQVYKTLRAASLDGSGIFSISKMLRLFGAGIGYIKLKIILSVLSEMGLCKIEEPVKNTYLVELTPSPEKTELSKSAILRRLEGQMKD
ncbi:MAG: single-stranded-DNA-specific exonuclease RecJ [Clostridia bacterium]|nr:single-stranded-DNA-specific exonuclease RecJ [Clostridia bacterium]